jgi:membrane carboxypeptidase/penicillin-binding protein PbpC
MSHRSAETATYAGEMARCEIEFPEDLLMRVDRAAKRAEETRDEFLRRVVEQEVVANEARFRKKLEEVLGPPEPMGGNAAELIREMRDNHPPIRRGNIDDG